MGSPESHLSTNLMRCFKCDKSLPEVFEDRENNQPYGGTSFVSHGHYGSTIFDPMDGSFLELQICDDCLAKGKERILLGHTRTKRETDYVAWNPEN